MEDSSRQEDKRLYESGEQRSPDPFKSLDENKKDENRETIEDKLSYDVGTTVFCFPTAKFFIPEQKYKNLEDMIKGKKEEEILNVRMHQLALAKVSRAPIF